jgi:hypothetical protein
MKRNAYLLHLLQNLVSFASALVFLVFGSCASFPFGSEESSSWAIGERNSDMMRGTIRINSVSVEKPGDWGSLEGEISDLLPLLFSEENFFVVASSAKADYSAEVKLREREYPDGWQTKRSLTAEVRLWEAEAEAGRPLPLSTGRMLVTGKQSFSSSKTLSAVLRKAVKKAVMELPPKSIRRER